MTSTHPSARISSTAVIAPSASVGQGTVIEDFVTIGENVTVGDNCYVMSGARIGIRPFAKSVGDQAGESEITLHPIHIGNDCLIGANAVIQYGVKRPTEIQDGCWVNNLCNIGHDVVLGAGSMIGLSTSISGHSVLGKKVTVGPGCTLTNRSEVGDRATIGIGSLVLHPVPEGMTVMGRPAVKREEHLESEKRLRELTGMERDSRKVTAPRTFFGSHPVGRLIRRMAKAVLRR
ncbi:MAG: DapH/DapD/GlmU-related protein [Pseudomonadota bacterium]